MLTFLGGVLGGVAICGVISIFSSTYREKAGEAIDDFTDSFGESIVEGDSQSHAHWHEDESPASNVGHSVANFIKRTILGIVEEEPEE